MSRTLPAPPDAGVFNAIRFGTQTFRFLEGIQARFSDGTAVSLPGRPPLVIITNPTLVHEALGRPADFGRVPPQRSATLIAERGLVQSEGELWDQQRSIISPAFSELQVQAYTETTAAMADGLVRQWLDRGPQRIDLHRAMTSMTVRAASAVLLGRDIGQRQAEEFYDWMRIAGRQFEFGLEVVTPRWLPERITPEFRRAAEGIRTLASDLIDERRATLSDDGSDSDMLARLLLAQADPDIDLSDEQIRDEVATFLIAGHETTAISLTYTVSLLAWHSDIRDRIRMEAMSRSGDDFPGYEDLHSLSRTRRAYLEGLRLYPPAWAIFRRASGEVTLGAYRIEDGSAVVLPQWSIHRDDRHFQNPGTFTPSRWADLEDGANKAFFPFASGPHACIGRRFALSGATVSLARILRDVAIDVPNDALADLRVTPTLRPSDGVTATVRPA